MSKTVLIIDDSKSMRSVIAFTLGQAGYKTIEANDGHDALVKLTENTIDLIISDLNMPNMDGLTFLTYCKKNPECQSIPVIMLTTENKSEQIVAGKKIGASAWMIKPFDPDMLIKTLSTISH